MATSTIAALIMAGGRSERMRAGGTDQHKGLRTVLGVPLIECNIRALLWFGFKELFVAISIREQALASWIERRGRALAEAGSATLEILVEREPLGTIGAVASLPQAIEEVVIVNVDNLTSLDLRQLAQFHLSSGAAATVASHEQGFRIPFGMLELAGQRVVAYREKPEVFVPISSGTYVLDRRAIDRVPLGRRLDLPALIDSLLKDGESVLAYPHQERWLDVNDEAALTEAQRLLSCEGSRWPGLLPRDGGGLKP